MIACIFPGQGSQAVGMGKALADQFPICAQTFAEADAALGESLSGLIFNGPSEQLTLTANTQPAILTMGVAVWRLLSERGLSPSFLAGHSLGEYSAHVAAGTLAFADAVRLVRHRGRYMQEAVPVGQGAMAALLGAEWDLAVEIAKEAAQGECCDVANDNGGGQVVLSGAKAAIDRACVIAKEKGVKRAMLLPVSAPFHSSLMQPAAEAMQVALATATIKAPKVPVIANVLAAPVTDPEAIRRHLVEQVTGSVRWRESMLWLGEAGVTKFIECGSGKVLTGIGKRLVAGSEAVNIGTPEDVAGWN